jgi:hypothetical protein
MEILMKKQHTISKNIVVEFYWGGDHIYIYVILHIYHLLTSNQHISQQRHHSTTLPPYHIKARSSYYIMSLIIILVAVAVWFMCFYVLFCQCIISGSETVQWACPEAQFVAELTCVERRCWLRALAFVFAARAPAPGCDDGFSDESVATIGADTAMNMNGAQGRHAADSRGTNHHAFDGGSSTGQPWAFRVEEASYLCVILTTWIRPPGDASIDSTSSGTPRKWHYLVQMVSGRAVRLIHPHVQQPRGMARPMPYQPLWAGTSRTCCVTSRIEAVAVVRRLPRKPYLGTALLLGSNSRAPNISEAVVPSLRHAETRASPAFVSSWPRQLPRHARRRALPLRESAREVLGDQTTASLASAATTDAMDVSAVFFSKGQKGRKWKDKKGQDHWGQEQPWELTAESSWRRSAAITANEITCARTAGRRPTTRMAQDTTCPAGSDRKVRH